MEGHYPNTPKRPFQGGKWDSEAETKSPQSPKNPQTPRAGGLGQIPARAERNLRTAPRGIGSSVLCSIVWNIKWKLIHGVTPSPASPPSPPAPLASLIERREANEVRAHLSQTRTREHAGEAGLYLPVFSIPAGIRSLKT